MIRKITESYTAEAKCQTFRFIVCPWVDQCLSVCKDSESVVPSDYRRFGLQGAAADDDDRLLGEWAQIAEVGKGHFQACDGDLAGRGCWQEKD